MKTYAIAIRGNEALRRIKSLSDIRAGLDSSSHTPGTPVPHGERVSLAGIYGGSLDDRTLELHRLEPGLYLYWSSRGSQWFRVPSRDGYNMLEYVDAAQLETLVETAAARELLSLLPDESHGA